MDPISNADRFVRLIRQRLEEKTKAKTTVRLGNLSSVRAHGPEAISALAGTFAQGGADDQQLRRSLVEQLLADQFGSALVNEARFQQIVDQVKQVMEDDPEIDSLIAQVIGKIRAS